MRCLPILFICFSQWTNLIGPSHKKMKLWRLPKIEGFILKYWLPPLWPTHMGKRRTILYKKANMVSVSVFVVTNRARQGQDRAGQPGQTPAHSRSFLVTPGKAIVVVFVCVGSAWKILPVTARSLWSFPRCNFPRCNWFHRKKKSGVVWFFEAKDLVD